MIQLSEKTWRFPDTGISLPCLPMNILPYLLGQNETLTCDLSTPTTTDTYAYDSTCFTCSHTTGATTTNHYDSGNSSINRGKPGATYDYDNICDIHQSKSRSNNKATRADSRVYYYGYRYYSPELGRWPSRDPVGEVDGGSNLYAFLQNHSINNVDKLGLYDVKDCVKWRVDMECVCRNFGATLDPGTLGDILRCIAQDWESCGTVLYTLLWAVPDCVYCAEYKCYDCIERWKETCRLITADPAGAKLRCYYDGGCRGILERVRNNCPLTIGCYYGKYEETTCTK